jgi:hypothetical protein
MISSLPKQEEKQMQTNDDAIEALKALFAIRPDCYADGVLKENDPEQHRPWKRAEQVIKRSEKKVSPLSRAA